MQLRTNGLSLAMCGGNLHVPYAWLCRPERSVGKPTSDSTRPGIDLQVDALALQAKDNILKAAAAAFTDHHHWHHSRACQTGLH